MLDQVLKNCQRYFQLLIFHWSQIAEKTTPWMKMRLNLIQVFTSDLYSCFLILAEIALTSLFSVLFKDDIDIEDPGEKPKGNSMMEALNKQKLTSKFNAFKGQSNMVKDPCWQLVNFYQYYFFVVSCNMQLLLLVEVITSKKHRYFFTIAISIMQKHGFLLNSCNAPSSVLHKFWNLEYSDKRKQNVFNF